MTFTAFSMWDSRKEFDHTWNSAAGVQLHVIFYLGLVDCGKKKKLSTISQLKRPLVFVIIHYDAYDLNSKHMNTIII